MQYIKETPTESRGGLISVRKGGVLVSQSMALWRLIHALRDMIVICSFIQKNNK